MAGEFQLRELSGSAFKNDRKTQYNHPDYRGSCKIDGREYWVSLWIKENARGKWLSMSYQAKDGSTAQPAKATVPVPSLGLSDDDMPF